MSHLDGLLPGRAYAAGRWFVVAIAFVAVNATLLYMGHDLLRMPLAVATVFAGEVSTLLRFLANDRWVFGYTRPTWRRCWQFHVTVIASFALWALVTDALTVVGVHYLLASVMGNMSTAAWGLSTSFLWVWRPSNQPAIAVAGDEPAVHA